MPLPITAQMLNDWSSRLEARHLLPVLIRRLVRETVPPEKIREIDFPGYENVMRAGMDGWLITTAHYAYVPDGESVWEFGTGQDIKRKAESDFKKRLNQAKSDATFIFVSSRNWTSKGKWLEEKKQTGWKTIKVLDASDLEQWLEQSPVTSVWLSEKMGQAQAHLETSDMFLQNWLEATEPEFPPELLLNNRGIAVEEIKKFLSDGQSGADLPVIADTQDEAVAFICATLEKLKYSDRPVVVLKNKEAINEVGQWQINFERPMLLIAHSKNIAKAIPTPLTNANILIIAGTRDGTVRRSSSEEGRNNRHSSVVLRRVKNFDNVFSDRSDSETHYKRTGGSVSALHRISCKNSSRCEPEWSKITADDRNFIWLALLGRWDEMHDSDKNIICTLSGFEEYQQWQDFVQGLVSTEEPPLEKTYGAKKGYRLFSRVDAFLTISQKIKPEDISKFLNAAETVFGEADPNYRPASDEKDYHIHEGRNYSDFLRQGIADGLAILNLYKDDPLDCGDITVEVSGFYDAIFESPNAWFALVDILPILAEASPDDFIRKLNEALREDPEKIGDLFQPRPGIVWEDYKHPGLLWALEVLAWEPGRLETVMRLFCELQSRFESRIGDRFLNRPSQSMRDILRLLMPQTGAEIGERKSVLADLYNDYSKQVAELALALADKDNRTGNYTSLPIWRDDALGIPPVAIVEKIQMILAAIEIFIQYIGDERQDIDSRFELAERSLTNFHYWGEDFAQRATETICSLPCDNSILNESLSKEARRIWVWKNKVSKKEGRQNDRAAYLLKQIWEKFQPEDPLRKYTYLFTPRPSLENEDIEDEYKDREKKIEAARSKAVEDVLNQFGHDGLVDLLALSENSGALSIVLFKNYISKDKFNLEEYLFACLEKSDIDIFKLKNHVRYLFGWTEGHPNVPDALGASKVIKIIENVIRRLDDHGQVEQLIEKKVLLLHALRIDQLEVREHIDNRPAELKSHYFSDYRGSSPLECRPDEDSGEHPPESAWLVKNYIEHKHPRLGWFSFVVSDYIPFEKQIDLLEAIFTEGCDEGPESAPPPSSYDIERILEKSSKQPLSDEQEDRLMNIEFKFFRFLDYDFRENGGIFILRHIDKKPSFLIQLAKYIYKTDDGKNSNDDLNQNSREFYTITSFEILDNLNLFSEHFPWVQEQGELDELRFFRWVEGLRQIAKDEKMIIAVDIILGKGLSKEVVSDDDLRPLPVACEILERFGSENMFSEFRTGWLNNRGVLSGGIDDKGHSTAGLAEHYRGLTEDLQKDYPATASIMKQLAQHYHEDAEIELREQSTRDLDGR